jgi:hypothetical protein
MGVAVRSKSSLDVFVLSYFYLDNGEVVPLI